MDIEGTENSVVMSFLEMPRRSKLPYQVAVETHGGFEAEVFLRAMASLGYVAVNKEQNAKWNSGWEWTWVRASCDLTFQCYDRSDPCYVFNRTRAIHGDPTLGPKPTALPTAAPNDDVGPSLSDGAADPPDADSAGPWRSK